MRKTLTILSLVFAFAFGAMTPASVDAANCYYTCTCEGTPLYCCKNGSVTTCKFTKVIQCTQGYNC